MSKVNKLITKLCPDGVDSKRLAELFKISRGRVMSKEYLRDNVGKFPVYSSQTASNGEIGRIATYDYDGEFLTWTTDGANAGTVFRRNGRFNCTNVCGTLLPKLRMDLSFMQYSLDFATTSFVRLDINPKLMNNVMSRIRVQFPPIQEQIEIAAYINEEIKSIDALIAKAEQFIERLREHRTALIAAAVTGKIDVRTLTPQPPLPGAGEGE